ncbi:MAG: DUF951 domain-containing protein [Ruminococcaceae bacterium]|nr:DUF951 domain-containing protein [Oscillospiraceae bacterium]
MIPLHPGDILLLKKPHPCGGNRFLVMRVGSQVRMVCQTCNHDMTLDRIKLEKAIRQILPFAEEKKGTENQ